MRVETRLYDGRPRIRAGKRDTEPGAPCLTAEWAQSAENPDEHAASPAGRKERRAKALRHQRFGGDYVDEEPTEESGHDGERPPRTYVPLHTAR
jgi:hypothetical protein